MMGIKLLHTEFPFILSASSRSRLFVARNEHFTDFPGHPSTFSV